MKNNNILPVVIAILFCYWLCGCKSQKNNAVIRVNADSLNRIDHIKKARLSVDSAASLLRDGDLVTRSDDDFESLAIQNFSKTDRSFSHSGIAFKEDGIFVVYHSMTGIENPGGKCRRDPFDSFADPSKKTGVGIFRYTLLPQEVIQFHTILKQQHEAKIPFDINFNLDSDDSLYCSEMIYKDLKKVTKNRIILPSTVLLNYKPKMIGYPYSGALRKRFEYIAVDNLYLNSFCKEIKRIKYE